MYSVETYRIGPKPFPYIMQPRHKILFFIASLVATEICRLRWNWFYLILLAPVISISYNSIISSFHQFVTNPTAEQLNGTWKEDKVKVIPADTSYCHTAYHTHKTKQ